MLRYHADGPEGHEAVASVGVAPGIPARILSLLQDEHLATEVGLLKSNKARAGGAGIGVKHRGREKKSSREEKHTWRREVKRYEELKSLLCVGTYGPHSTMILRTLSMPRSHTFIHSFWTSIILPWKFSWSNSMICTEGISDVSGGLKENPVQFNQIPQTNVAHGTFNCNLFRIFFYF